jgi:hypothetical protein
MTGNSFSPGSLTILQGRQNPGASLTAEVLAAV